MPFQSAQPTYAHRHNSDGTVASICTECFRTIGQTAIKETLRSFEQSHLCPNGILSDGIAEARNHA